MSSAQDAPNRRRFPRRACQLRVRCRSGEGWRPATALDLTSHGCRLGVDDDLARGAPVTVSFDRPLTDGTRDLTVEIPGVVAWFRLAGPSREIGVRFDEEATGLQAILEELAR